MSSSPDNEARGPQQQVGSVAEKPVDKAAQGRWPTRALRDTDQYSTPLPVSSTQVSLRTNSVSGINHPVPGGQVSMRTNSVSGTNHPVPGGRTETTRQVTVVGPRVTGHLTGSMPVGTRPLAADMPVITRRLELSGAGTTTRGLTVIPGATKRKKVEPSKVQARRRSPLVLVSVLVSSVLMLTLASFLVAPLATGQQNTISQTINTFFSTGGVSSFDLQAHAAPPTPTPTPTPTPPPALMNGGDSACHGGSLWDTCAGESTKSGVIGTGVMTTPLPGAVITQYFGHPEYQYWCGCTRPHSGIDLAAAYGTALLAADSGEVIWTGWDTTGLGWAVKISHGHYIATVYAHMARFLVSVGDTVTKGQVIGYEGSSGQSTGPHVHFMVLVNNKWVDPTLYIQF